MLTDDEIKAIEVRAERADGFTRWAAGLILSQDVPALLADRRELVALAQELASTRQDGDLWRHLMARCRAAGLLEGK